MTDKYRSKRPATSRQCRNRHGIRKPELTEQEAREHAAKARNAHNVDLNAYKCTECDHWHVGRDATTLKDGQPTIRVRLNAFDLNTVVDALVAASAECDHFDEDDCADCHQRTDLIARLERTKRNLLGRDDSPASTG